MYNKITYYRKELGLNQDQLAFELDITRPTLSSYEKGERMPKLDMIDKMLEFFEVEFYELFYK